MNMKIVKTTPSVVEFKDLKPGDVYEFNGDIYIKIDLGEYEGQCGANSINLSFYSMLLYVYPTDKVIPLKATTHVSYLCCEGKKKKITNS